MALRGNSWESIFTNKNVILLKRGLKGVVNKIETVNSTSKIKRKQYQQKTEQMNSKYSNTPKRTESTKVNKTTKIQANT